MDGCERYLFRSLFIMHSTAKKRIQFRYHRSQRVPFVLHFIVEPACGERDIVVTISVRCMSMRACVGRACIRPNLPGLSLLYLCINFKIIWHSRSPGGVKVPFRTFFR